MRNTPILLTSVHSDEDGKSGGTARNMTSPRHAINRFKTININSALECKNRMFLFN